MCWWLLEQYCGTPVPGPAHLPNITDMFTDAFFLVGVDRYISHHLQYSNQPLFQYINHHINDVAQVLSWSE